MPKSVIDFSPSDLGISTEEFGTLGITTEKPKIQLPKSTVDIKDNLGFSDEELFGLGIGTKTGKKQPIETPYQPKSGDIKIDLPQPIGAGPYAEDVARRQEQEKRNIELYGEPMPHGDDKVVRPAIAMGLNIASMLPQLPKMYGQWASDEYDRWEKHLNDLDAKATTPEEKRLIAGERGRLSTNRGMFEKAKETVKPAVQPVSDVLSKKIQEAADSYSSIPEQANMFREEMKSVSASQPKLVDDLLNSARLGKLDLALDWISAQAMARGDKTSADEMKRLSDDYKKVQDGQQKYGMVREALKGVARMAPGLVGSMALSSIPVIGVPATFTGWAAQGAGQVYREATEAGADPDKARISSTIAAPIYAAIEYSQIGKLNRIPQVRGALKRAIAEYGIDLAKEVNEEGLQGAVQYIAGEVAKGNENTEDVARGAFKSYLENAKQSALSLAIVGAPAKAAGYVASREKQETPTAPETAPGSQQQGPAKPVPPGMPDLNLSTGTGPTAATQPTEAQKEAGNYKKEHIRRDGMDISIENPAGSVRSGTDQDGKKWSVTMNHDYGYIKGTVGRDKDHIDTFIKPGSKEGSPVFVVDQVDPKTGKFDEHKVMMGFDSMAEARDAYLSNYEQGWKGIGAITEMPMDRFKTWAYAKGKRGPLGGSPGYEELKNIPPTEKAIGTPPPGIRSVLEKTGPERTLLDFNIPDERAFFDLPDEKRNSIYPQLSKADKDRLDSYTEPLPPMPEFPAGVDQENARETEERPDGEMQTQAQVTGQDEAQKREMGQKASAAPITDEQKEEIDRLIDSGYVHLTKVRQGTKDYLKLSDNIGNERYFRIDNEAADYLRYAVPKEKMPILPADKVSEEPDDVQKKTIDALIEKGFKFTKIITKKSPSGKTQIKKQYWKIFNDRGQSQYIPVEQTGVINYLRKKVGHSAVPAFKMSVPSQEIEELTDEQLAQLPPDIRTKVSAIQERARKSEQEAATDPLTGAMTRRGLDRQNIDLKNNAVVMIDADKFKDVNDKHGHPVGDQVLKSIAEILKNRFDGVAHVVRMGGEEFGIFPLQNEINQGILDRVAEANLDFSRLSFDDGKLTGMTFSAGAAQSGPGVSNTIDEADRQLYLAKKSGRAQTRFKGKPHGENPTERSRSFAAPERGRAPEQPKTQDEVRIRTADEGKPGEAKPGPGKKVVRPRGPRTRRAFDAAYPRRDGVEYTAEYNRNRFFTSFAADTYLAFKNGWKDRNGKFYNGSWPGWFFDYLTLADRKGKPKQALRHQVTDRAIAYMQDQVDRFEENPDAAEALREIGIDPPEHHNDIRAWLEQSMTSAEAPYQKNQWKAYNDAYHRGEEWEKEEGEKTRQEEIDAEERAYYENLRQSEDLPESVQAGIDLAAELSAAFNVNLGVDDVQVVVPNDEERLFQEAFLAVLGPDRGPYFAKFSKKTENSVGGAFNGVTMPDGRIFINTDAPRPVPNILAHETMHTMAIDNPIGYRGFIDFVDKNLTELGERAVDQRFKDENLANRRKALEEIAGDILDDNVGNPRFWKLLYAKSPRLVQDVLDALKKVYDRLLAAASRMKLTEKAWFKDATAVRRELAKFTADTIAIKQGRLAADRILSGENPMFQIMAFHGTRHKFNKFEMRPYTGEGHMAFGYGLYFTNSEDIGAFYAKSFKEMLIGGKTFDELGLTYSAQNRLLNTIRATGRSQSAKIGIVKKEILAWIDSINSATVKNEKEIENLDTEVSWGVEGDTVVGTRKTKDGKEIKYAIYDADKRSNLYEKSYDRKYIVWGGKGNVIQNAGFDTLEKAKEFSERHEVDEIKRINNGNKNRVENLKHIHTALGKKDFAETQAQLYSVIIHKGKTTDEYDYLQWDKPISEKQITAINNYYGKNIIDRVRSASGTGFSNNPSGEDVYKYLSSKEDNRGFGKDAQGASMALLRAGIDGIEYPAGTLSGKVSEARNYVVFDPEAVTIENRLEFQKTRPEAVGLENIEYEPGTPEQEARGREIEKELGNVQFLGIQEGIRGIQAPFMQFQVIDDRGEQHGNITASVDATAADVAQARERKIEQIPAFQMESRKIYDIESARAVAQEYGLEFSGSRPGPGGPDYLFTHKRTGTTFRAKTREEVGRAVGDIADRVAPRGTVKAGEGVRFQKTKREDKETGDRRQDTEQIYSPEFKRWFGDWENDPKNASKVVDAEGKPLVVYHGTDKEFNEFKNMGGKQINIFGSVPVERQGYFFASTEKQALGFGKNIKSVYLTIKKPFDFTDGDFENILNDIESAGINKKWIEKTEPWELFDGDDGKIFVSALAKKGYDGVVFNEPSAGVGRGGKAYITFSPTQIKSATGNRGTFDPNNPDIRFQRTHRQDINAEQYDIFGGSKTTEELDREERDRLQRAEIARRQEERIGGEADMAGLPLFENQDIEGSQQTLMFQRVKKELGPVDAEQLDLFATVPQMADVLGSNSMPTEARVVMNNDTVPLLNTENTQQGIMDVGEKIGAARKDMAEKGITRTETRKDDRPWWMKRFISVQEIKSGKWKILDNKTGKYLYNSNAYSFWTFESMEEADRAVPLVAVSQNFRVRSASREENAFVIVKYLSNGNSVEVRSGFPSNADAMKYMVEHAADLLAERVSKGEESLVKPIEPQRKGPERRQGDVTAQMLMDTFGFRGVEFGNWEKQDERQQVVNYAYDGLMDLAEIIGVDPKALSLRGELALAFGARGTGASGSRAHYEPQRAVINLTKMSGAGSLAHEWFHAFDHYMARIDTKATSERVPSSEGGMVYKTTGHITEGEGRQSKLRKEMIDAFRRLMKTIRNKTVERTVPIEVAERGLARYKENLDQEIKQVRNSLMEDWTRYKKRGGAPATQAQLKAYDDTIAGLMEGKGGAIEWKRLPESKSLYGGYAYTNAEIEKLSAIYKTVRGRSGRSDGHGPIDGLAAALKSYQVALQNVEKAKAGTVDQVEGFTDFYKGAKRLDSARTTAYWTEPTELGARAFSAYVEDRISQREQLSEFLSYGSDNRMYKLFGMDNVYPEGDERIAINAALADLFDAIETQEEGGRTVMFQKTRADTFFSPTLRAVQALKQERGTGDQMFAMITKTPGVKEAEWKWMGLDDFLKGKQSVTRQEIENFVRQNQVRVEEVEKGTELTPLKWEKTSGDYGIDVWIGSGSGRSRYKIEKLINGKYRYRSPGGVEELYNSLDEAKNEANYNAGNIGDLEKIGTKYSQYTLPGGENYREVLLTLPVKEDLKNKYKIVPVGERYSVYRDGKEVAWVSTEEQANNFIESEINRKKTFGGYRSSHWEEPNVIAHIRLDDRTGPNGEKVLFVEEIQSDWAREAREKGIYDPEKIKTLKNNYDVLIDMRFDTEKKSTKIFQELMRSGKSSTEALADPVYLAATEETKNLQPRIDDAKRAYKAIEKNPGPPAQPFLKNWEELTLKRVLRMAAEEGYDRVAWINGTQTADRYDLSKQVSQVVYNPETKELVARGMDSGDLIREKVEPVEIEKYIGKGPAQKLLESPTLPTGKGRAHMIEGEDLRVGGEWASTLYDRMIPKFYEKYGKKWGTKVEPINLGEQMRDQGEVVMNDTGPQQSIPITPEMRESVIYEGQPMFQKRKKEQRPVIDQILNQPEGYEDIQITDMPAKGFMLPDGRYLDVTGISDEHRVINGMVSYPDDSNQTNRTQKMYRIMKDAELIRFIPESNSFQLKTAPTRDQVRELGRYIKDNGEAEIEFENGRSARYTAESLFELEEDLERGVSFQKRKRPPKIGEVDYTPNLAQQIPAEERARARQAEERAKELQDEIASLRGQRVFKTLPDGTVRMRAEIELGLQVKEKELSEQEAELVRGQIYDYAKALGLRGLPYNQVDTMLKNSRTAGDLRRSIERLDRIWEQATRREAVKNLYDLIDRKYKKLRALVATRRPPTTDIENNRRLREYLDNLIGLNKVEDKDHINKMLAWMQREGPKNVRNKELYEMPESVRDYVEGKITDIPDSMSNAVRGMFKDQIETMPLSRIKQIIADIESIEETGKTQKEIIDQEIKERRDKESRAIASEIGAHAKKKPQDSRKRASTEERYEEARKRRKNIGDQLDAWMWEMRDIDRIGVALTGKTQNTAFERFLVRPLAEAYAKWKMNMRSAEAFLKSNYGNLDVARARRDKSFGTIKKLVYEFNDDGSYKTKEDGSRVSSVQEFPMTLEEALLVYAHSVNGTQREHLIASIDPENREQSDAEINRIIKTIPQEWKAAVERQWKYFSTVQWDMMNEPFAALHQIDMDKEENYFPCNNLDNAFNDETIEVDLLARATGQAAVRAGATESRVVGAREKGAARASPFRHFRYFDALIKNMYQASHYNAMALPVREAQKILGNEGVRTGIDRVSRNARPVLMDWLKSLAYGKWSYGERDGAFESLLRGLRRNAGSYQILGRATSVLVQISSLPRGFIGTQKKYLIGAVASMAKHPVKLTRAIDEKSPNMATRSREYEQAISEFMESEDGKRLTKTLKPVDQARIFFGAIIGGVDKIYASISWYARYSEAIENGADEKTAIYEADKVVRKTQSGGGLFAATGMQRGPEGRRIFTQFMSDAIKATNLLDELIQGWNDLPAAKKANYILWGMVFPAILTQFVRTGFEPWREPEETLKEFLLQSFYSIPIAGQVAEVLVNAGTDWLKQRRGVATKRGWQEYAGQFEAPAMSIVQDATKDFLALIDVNKWRSNAPKNILNGIDLAAILAGIPGGGQLKRISGGMEDFRKTHDFRYFLVSKTRLEEGRNDLLDKSPERMRYEKEMKFLSGQYKEAIKKGDNDKAARIMKQREAYSSKHLQKTLDAEKEFQDKKRLNQ
jgi:diguanylate cyclase (GGDEF)-like protein